MDKAKLDQEETQILESYDRDEWKSVDDFEADRVATEKQPASPSARTAG